MSSVNTLTGRQGKFGIANVAVARTTQWAVNSTLASSSEWGDSDSAGFTNRAAGRKDCTFTAEGKYDSASEQFDIFQAEDILQCTLWLDGLAANIGNQLHYDFPRALCNDFNLTVDIDTEEVIGWTSGWGSDGPFFRPGEVAADNPPVGEGPGTRSLA